MTENPDKITECFEGRRLYGNNFSIDEIKKWYEEETEGYANLGSKNKNTYSYSYDAMNSIHGFNKLKDRTFNNALGFGSAWGKEFEPIADRIQNLTIVEPSDNLKSDKIGNLVPNYVKPAVSGQLPFADNSFDLITCFGTLHHIPNVSFVFSELARVLQPGGYFLMREPITSMGDWRKPRRGLTKNERGIPVGFFDREIKGQNLHVISREFCFTATSFLQKTFGQLFKRAIWFYPWYVKTDKFVSRLLRGLIKYHPLKLVHKMAPKSVFYVLKKDRLAYQ